ncbi:MAG: hypothetical protein ACI95C_001263 [Pseudohongiellaceae bacterium]|jgi:hypothetical protein
MNLLLKYSQLAALLFFCGLSYGSNFDRVGNFALLDHEGVYHELRKYGDSKAVVIIATSPNCEKNLNQLPKYQLLRTMWERRGISFVALDSSPKAERERVSQLDYLHHLNLPILLDDSQLVTQSLGISVAGQIVVVEPNRNQILYRGGISGLSENTLELVLNAVSNASLDSLHSTMETTADGCSLDFSATAKFARNAPDYARDIAPILKENCVTCHVDGGIAPFAMNSHKMVQGWSSMMREVLMTKRMPPAQVDPAVNHFENAGYLSTADLQTLVNWIDAGSPAADSAQDPLTMVSMPTSVWQLGEPDYVVEVPAFTVPATGVLDYENVTVNLPFDKAVWVKSVQHLPGDRRVLHHLLSFIVPADYSQKIVEGENDESREFLEGYAPGKEEAVTFPEDSGVFVPAGSAVQLSLHYTTFGKEAVDRTQIGLYFADSEPKYKYSTYSLSHGGKNIRIPPRDPDHQMSASYVFEDEIVLHGLRPHMHYRGKNMRMSVIYPGGTRDDILNVPNYSFAWQPTYRLSEPMLLPAGSRVMIEGAFDNSQYNLGNPDPEALVKGGAQSWDEMFIGYFSYYKTQQ